MMMTRNRNGAVVGGNRPRSALKMVGRNGRSKLHDNADLFSFPVQQGQSSQSDLPNAGPMHVRPLSAAKRLDENLPQVFDDGIIGNGEDQFENEQFGDEKDDKNLMQVDDSTFLSADEDNGEDDDDDFDDDDDAPIPAIPRPINNIKQHNFLEGNGALRQVPPPSSPPPPYPYGPAPATYSGASASAAAYAGTFFETEFSKSTKI